MRKIALLPTPQPNLKRLLLHEDAHDVHLFGYDTPEDAGCLWDEWVETVADAEKEAQERYQVAPAAWQTIADPLPDCQYDWISPVRVVGRSTGRPEWGKLEILTDGQ
jgi:hypothetical protein